jgi:hypothetical protein
MDGFQKHRSSFPAMEAVYEPAPGSSSHRPYRPSGFAADVHRLLGDDLLPDALFFVESWTLNSQQALENLRQRRRDESRQPAAPPRDTTRDSGSLGSSFFAPQNLSGRAGDPGTPPRMHPVNSARVSTAQSRNPAARSGQYKEEEGAETGAGPMTLQNAWQVLGVSEDSTRAEIRSAYRRLVSRWHPDRLGATTEEARTHANEQMAAINQAYRYLCNQPQPEQEPGRPTSGF